MNSRLLIGTLALLAATWCCKKGADQVAVQPKSDYLEAGAGSMFVTVTATKDWTLSLEYPAGTDAWASVDPASGSASRNDVRLRFEANAAEPVAVALERAGIHAPSKCRSGECGFCRSRLGRGSVYVPSVIEYRRGADKKDGYVHPCCSFPTSDCQIFINCDKGEVERKVKDMKNKSCPSFSRQ